MYALRMKNSCSIHAEYSSGCLGCYLSQPCDECDATATHQGVGVRTGKPGKFCNTHTNFNHYARARND